jgi:hypothetical protein
METRDTSQQTLPPPTKALPAHGTHSAGTSSLSVVVTDHYSLARQAYRRLAGQLESMTAPTDQSAPNLCNPLSNRPFKRVFIPKETYEMNTKLKSRCQT